MEIWVLKTGIFDPKKNLRFWFLKINPPKHLSFWILAVNNLKNAFSKIPTKTTFVRLLFLNLKQKKNMKKFF